MMAFLNCETCKVSAWKQELKGSGIWRDGLAEFLAMFSLMSFQAALSLNWGQPSVMGGPVQVALGMGFIVCTMAWALGDFGGAHMSPAVSIGMAVSCRITLVRGRHHR